MSRRNQLSSPGKTIRLLLPSPQKWAASSFSIAPTALHSFPSKKNPFQKPTSPAKNPGRPNRPAFPQFQKDSLPTTLGVSRQTTKKLAQTKSQLRVPKEFTHHLQSRAPSFSPATSAASIGAALPTILYATRSS